MAFEDVEPGTELVPGDYILHYGSIGGEEAFPTLAMTFTVPGVWNRVLIDGLLWNDSGVRLGFAVVENLFADPCDPAAGVRNPPVGQSTDDLAHALGNVTGWEITEADSDVYFGYPGIRLVLSGSVDLSACPQGEGRLAHTPGFPGFIMAADVGERQEMWILQVETTRLVVNAVSSADAPAEDLDELQAILSSIQIQP